MQSIIPCLWFNNNAEEAAKFYVAVFNAVRPQSSRIKAVTRYGDAASKASGQPKGSVMTISLQLFGSDFLLLNGGPFFHFTPAISLMIQCQSQAEIDALTDQLATGDDTEQCGWVKDRFGISWQIVPAELEGMMSANDPAKLERVMAEVVKMKKLDIGVLKRAFDQH